MLGLCMSPCAAADLLLELVLQRPRPRQQPAVLHARLHHRLAAQLAAQPVAGHGHAKAGLPHRAGASMAGRSLCFRGQWLHVDWTQ